MSEWELQKVTQAGMERWELYEQVGGSASLVARVYDCSEFNARLIAEVPELLEACRAALDCCDQKNASKRAELPSLLKKVIGKATGIEFLPSTREMDVARMGEWIDEGFKVSELRIPVVRGDDGEWYFVPDKKPDVPPGVLAL